MKITVTCPSGLEGVTKKEIYSLLGIEAPFISGAATFAGGVEEVQKCNLFLRTASRVYFNLGGFKCSSFDDLFDGLNGIDFENYITADGKIFISATLVESKLNAMSATCSVAKKAIYTRLGAHYKKSLTESGARYKIHLSLHRDYLTVLLDTSGEGLHKRGYRPIISSAPVKENVAAALISLTVYKDEKPLIDPFCGSGTFLIEAAMRALKIPPGLNRDFDFLHFKKFDNSGFFELKKQAEEGILRDKKLNITGYDIDPAQISIAKKSAKAAGVSDYIDFESKDMRELKRTGEYGVIITNPPYGERLLTRAEIETLYRDFGKLYSDGFKDYSLYALTNVSDFERLIRKKAQKKRKIYNGKLECAFYSVFGEKPEQKE